MQETLKGKRLLSCTECMTAFEPSKNQKDNMRRVGRCYCSRECAKAFSARASRLSMQRLLKENAEGYVKRMKENNPMHMPGVKEKMIARLKEVGHRPKLRGGNGRGPTEPQKKIFDMLHGHGLVMEYVYTTRAGAGYPNHYKIDIASPDMKVAIEVDGGSHCTIKRREQDAKKDALLASRGWIVFRLSNSEIMKESQSLTSKLKEIITTLQTAS